MVKKNSMYILLAVILAIAIMVPYIILFTTHYENGKSAYELAVENGFVGTEQEWLNSLKGEKGDPQTEINSLYQSAVENGYTGSFDTWFEELKNDIKGDKGETGDTTLTYATNKAINSVVAIYSGFERRVTTYTGSGIWAKPGDTTTEVVYYTGAGSMFKMDEANKIAYFITNYHVIYTPISNVNRYGDEDTETGIKTPKHAKTIKLYYYGMNLTPSIKNMEHAIDAQYIGGSMSNDIAVLKVTGEHFDKLINGGVKPVEIGNSDDIRVGDSIIAIGNPEGEGISVTAGIISVDREILSMKAADETTDANFNVMRIDAAVNGGNSGGGLFDKNGNLIGVVNAKTVATEIEGMNYAIPINLAINIANNIVRNCNGTTSTAPQRCLLGITTTVSESKTVLNETTGKVDVIQKVMVYEISENSVAVNSNLEVGDIITSFTYNGKTYNVDRSFTISDFSYNFTSGSIVTLNVDRNNTQHSIDITLGSAQPIN